MSLSLSCPSQDRMVTRMQLAYNLLPPVQRCSSSRHTCAAEIQLVPILAKHHKLPTHLQFYCIFKSVELSWAQFDYIVCEGSWWFHTEIRTLNSRIRVQVSNPSTNNDMWKKELILCPIYYFKKLCSYVDSLRVMQKYAELCIAMQIYAELCRIMQSYVKLCKIMQKLSKDMQIYVKLCKFMQINAKLCMVMQIYQEFCKVTQSYAEWSKFMQCCAKLCKFTQSYAPLGKNM